MNHNQLVLYNLYFSTCFLIAGFISSIIFESLTILFIPLLLSLIFFKIAVFKENVYKVYSIFGIYTFPKNKIKMISLRFKPFVSEGGLMLRVSVGNIFLYQEINIFRKSKVYKTYIFLLKNQYNVILDVDDGKTKRKLIELKNKYEN